MRKKNKPCRPGNITKAKDEDPLGRMTHEMLSEAIEAKNLTEEKKKQYRQAYLW